MSVSTDDFLEQAFRLLEGANEIDHRSAISRGYYAAYHRALETAARLCLPGTHRNEAGVHEKLILRFEAQGKGLKKIARRLRDNKRARAAADYDIRDILPASEAALAVKLSRILVEDLGRLCTIARDTAK